MVSSKLQLSGQAKTNPRDSRREVLTMLGGVSGTELGTEGQVGFWEAKKAKKRLQPK